MHPHRIARAPELPPRTPRHRVPLGAPDAADPHPPPRRTPAGGGGRLAAVRVEAPRAAAAHVCSARERAQRGIRPDAAVLDGRRGHVARGRSATVPVALLPLLLVAALLEGDVERPHTFQCAASDRHVRAPCVARRYIVRTQVEGGDRRPLPTPPRRRATLGSGPALASE